MLAEGATFIDVGAYSSKPHAEFVSEDSEIGRIVPIVQLILKHYPNAIVSIDTFRAAVAQVALEHGAAMINDISAGSLDEAMFAVIAKHNVPYIMMHMRGTPQTMQSLTTYDDIIKKCCIIFGKVVKARSLGINDLIIDPGFGYKTVEQNYEVLRQLELFQMLELPVLAGFQENHDKTLGTDANGL
jgi:dihydropteroate synthase